MNFKPFDDMDLADLLEAQELQENFLASLEEEGEECSAETMAREKAVLKEINKRLYGE